MSSWDLADVAKEEMRLEGEAFENWLESRIQETLIDLQIQRGNLLEAGRVGRIHPEVVKQLVGDIDRQCRKLKGE